MPSNYVAYIDEAGDEGIGKLRSGRQTGQSHWLLLGAAVVRRSNDRLLPAWRDEILDLFPTRKHRTLHFRDLKHDQRVASCQSIARRQVGICVVASNKGSIPDSGKYEIFKRKGHLYSYLVRLLLERVTEVCRRDSERQGVRDPKLAVVFSRRGGTDYGQMRGYLAYLRDGRERVPPVREIDWGILDPADISVENHAKWAGLQIADLFTSATFAALEANRYGNLEPRYALTLGQRFLQRDGRVLNCGLTIVPAPERWPLTEDQLQFLSDLEKGSGPPVPVPHR